VEAGPPRRNRLVRRRFEIARAGVVRLDLEALAALDAQERLIFPVERVLPGLFACNALHEFPSPVEEYLNRRRAPHQPSTIMLLVVTAFMLCLPRPDESGHYQLCRYHDSSFLTLARDLREFRQPFS